MIENLNHLGLIISESSHLNEFLAGSLRTNMRWAVCELHGPEG